MIRPTPYFACLLLTIMLVTSAVYGSTYQEVNRASALSTVVYPLSLADQRASLYVDDEVADGDYLIDHFYQQRRNELGVHIISHGRPGELLIEGQWLDSKQIAQFIKSNFHLEDLTRDAEMSIYIYGCQFGHGPKGRAAIAYLEANLNVSISASNNITGKDGDWILEIDSGKKSSPFADVVYEYNLQCTAGPTERIISGRVYNDNNLNQVDNGEPGVQNVDVLIYEDVNQNGVLDAIDNLLTTVPSDAAGNYSFTSPPIVRTYADDFSGSVFNNTNNNSGTSDWANNSWIRDGNNAGIFNVRTFNGGDPDWNFTSQTVQLSDRDAGIYRLVDLSTATDATLTFEYDWDDGQAPSLDGGELFYIQIDPENDGTYIGLDTIVYVETEIPVTTNTITIPTALLGGATTRIRFITESASSTSPGEAWWIDNVELSVTDIITDYIATTDISTYPASFSLSTDNLETAALPSGGTCDDGNDFGLRFCSTGCPPIAEDDAVSIIQGESVQIFVLANDIDIDGAIDPSTLTLLTPPTNGSTNLDLATGTFIYTPVGAYLGIDQFTYEICDDTSPTPVCDVATVTINIIPRNLDVCEVANLDHTYYLPYPAEHLYTSLRNASSCPTSLTNDLRSIVSIKCPYPGAIIVYDHWEDGYEVDEFAPTQATSVRWGDGDLTNGIAPGYPNDLIPAGGNIVLDNTFNYNPRNPAVITFDGKDRLSTNSTIALSYIAGDDNVFTFQTAKTDVYDIDRFGTSFTVPFGENLAGVFQYTSLFIRASEDNTTVNVDADADGTNDFTQLLNQGEVFFIDGGVTEGALVTSDRPIGVDVLFGGLDCFGTRQVNLYPAAFYSDVYYTPVPTLTAANPVTIYLYNSLNRVLAIDWTSNSASGTLNVPANSSLAFQLPVGGTAYRFESQTGESYNAISIVDNGSAYDWSFNLIAASQLSNFASIAWAPGSLDGTRNDNPVWVTPTDNAVIYVKYDGNLADTSGNLSPCRIPFDTVIVLNELDYVRLYDQSDNDQSGLAVFTCDGTPIAAIYGEDPSTAVPGSPSLDVGTTIQPLCIDPAILANNDEDFTLIDIPVITNVLDNDRPFLTNIDTTSVRIVTTPANGSVVVNPDGTISYIPNPGYFGADQYQYFVCSETDPDLCDFATAFITIQACTAELTEKLLFGRVFNDLNQNGLFDAEAGISGVSVNIYEDVDQDGIISGGDVIIATEVTDIFGTYQTTITGNTTLITEDFNTGGYTGGVGWTGGWIETSEPGSNDPTSGDIRVQGNELVINDDDATIYRNLDLTTFTSATLSLDYRRLALETGEDLNVQISTNGGTSYTTLFTVFANNGTDFNFLNSGNIDLTPFVGNNVRLRFQPTGPWFGNFGNDDLFIDNIIITAQTLPSYFIVEPIEATVPSSNVPTSTSPVALFVPAGGTCVETNFGYTNLCEIGLDSDGDGISDACDLDDDNDGIPDTDEHSPCDSVTVAGYDALWNFENNTNDASTNNYDAVNTPGESYSSESVAGNSSVEFDGSFFIQYSDGTFLNQAITSFTYSFWFNPASFSGLQYLVDEGGTGNGISIRMNNNFLEARIKEGSIIEDAESFILGRTNIWYHVVLTYNNGDLTFYLNNEAKPVLSTTIGTLNAHGDGSGFGGSNGGNTYSTSGINGFSGLMDQVIHYPFALNPAQVETLYFICDTDQDGVPNRLDLDSDNDGILDAYEAGHGLPADSDGVITNSDIFAGINGLDDRVETAADSDVIGYPLSDSEPTSDGLYDPYELDSDDDGCYDSQEATVIDTEPDGIAGTGVPTVDGVGRVLFAIPYFPPPDNSWQDPAVYGAYCQCRVAVLNPHIMYNRRQ